MGEEAVESGELLATRSAWRALAGRWRLTWAESRELLPSGGEQEAEPPEDTAVRMRVLVEIGHRLGREGVDLRDWLREPQLLFGLRTTLEVMSGPRAELLRLRMLVERGFGS